MKEDMKSCLPRVVRAAAQCELQELLKGMSILSIFGVNGFPIAQISINQGTATDAAVHNVFRSYVVSRFSEQKKSSILNVVNEILLNLCPPCLRVRILLREIFGRILKGIGPWVETLFTTRYI